MENRRFTRVDFRVDGVLTGPSGTIRGTVENLSLAGMLLRTNQSAPVGERVHVHIALCGQQQLAIETDGRILRSEAGCLALEFELTGIDVDSLTHLRNVVAYNLGDDEQVIRELLEHLHKRSAG